MNREREITTEPVFNTKAEEIAFLREQLNKERHKRYGIEHELKEQSILKACLRDPKENISFDKLNVIDKRMYAYNYWDKLSTRQKMIFTDKDYKDAEESYKNKVKERMSDPFKMRAYFLMGAAPILDNMIDMALGESNKSSDPYAFKEVWEVLKSIIDRANDKAPILNLKDKDVSEQINEILTKLTAGDISFEQSKEYMSLVSSGFNLQELPKLMAKLEALEN